MDGFKANTYINFTGQAREAMQFYQKVFGGELTLFASNPTGAPVPAGPEDSVMHSLLESPDGFVLMGTDGMEGYPPTHGDNLAISLTGKDKTKLTEIFNGLKEGGKVKQDLQAVPWGDIFGFLEDKYGINWMIDIVGEKPEAS